jgi:hypothetical protein
LRSPAPGTVPAMEQRANDPEHELEHAGDELEERLERLEDHLDHAKDELEARKEDTDEPLGDTAGDWQETHDEAGGEDPEGAGRAKDDDDGA